MMARPLTPSAYLSQLSRGGHSLSRFGLWLRRRAGYLHTPLSLGTYMGRAWPDQDVRDSPMDK